MQIPPELIHLESDCIARLRKTGEVEEGGEEDEKKEGREKRPRSGGKTQALKRQTSREQLARVRILVGVVSVAVMVMLQAKRRTAVHKELECQRKQQTGVDSDNSEEPQSNILARFRK